MNRYLIALIIVIAIHSCKTNSNLSGENEVSPIEYSMDNSAKFILENPEINSISIGVYKNGQTFTNYYGEIDKGKGNKANDNSIFEIASVTKTFTAFLTAQAILKGKLNLNDDIRSYLNGTYDNLQYDNRPILINDILTHTTGIQREQFSKTLANLFSIDATKNEKNAIANYKKENFIDDLKHYQLETVPGKVYDYSGFVAPEILALILEQVYQKPYQQLLQESILDKANMHHTSLKIDADKEELINGYTNNNRLVEPIQMPLTGAGGGLKSTVPDMLQYIKFLLKEHKVVQEMSKPLFYDEKEGDEYGYFWMVDGNDLMLHNGGTGGSVNWLVLLPKMKSGFTISFNYNGDKANDLINTLASLLINDLVIYPTKNAYYVIRDFIREHPNNWQEAYYQLKKEGKKAYNLDDESLLNDIGYELIGQNKVKEAIEVFQLLVAEFPNSANAFDSLGEGFYLNKEYKFSIANYKKSLQLNPKNKNAMEMIEKMETL